MLFEYCQLAWARFRFDPERGGELLRCLWQFRGIELNERCLNRFVGLYDCSIDLETQRSEIFFSIIPFSSGV